MKTLALGGTLASKRLRAKLGHISICVTVYSVTYFAQNFPYKLSSMLRTVVLLFTINH